MTKDENTDYIGEKAGHEAGQHFTANQFGNTGKVNLEHIISLSK